MSRDPPSREWIVSAGYRLPVAAHVESAMLIPAATLCGAQRAPAGIGIVCSIISATTNAKAPPLVNGVVSTKWEQMNVGGTPLISLAKLAPGLPSGVQVFGKAEFLNPSASIKDRIVEYILDEQERLGRLVRNSGQTIVAASSGNTAASLAMFSAMRGYKCILITNRKTSAEKVQQLHAYGAEVIVTAAGVPADHPEHYQNVENRLVEENPSYFGLNQYDNPLNPAAYYATLGPELWEQTGGRITHFVAAGSTGGTISGTTRYLKEQNPEIQAHHDRISSDR